MTSHWGENSWLLNCFKQVSRTLNTGTSCSLVALWSLTNNNFVVVTPHHQKWLAAAEKSDHEWKSLQSGVATTKQFWQWHSNATLSSGRAQGWSLLLRPVARQGITQAAQTTSLCKNVSPGMNCSKGSTSQLPSHTQHWEPGCLPSVSRKPWVSIRFRTTNYISKDRIPQNCVKAWYQQLSFLFCAHEQF